MSYVGRLAKGSLISSDSFNNAELVVGADDTVLTADSTSPLGLKWATVATTGTTVSSRVTQGSAVSLANGVPIDLTSITLLPGKWSISAVVQFIGSPSFSTNFDPQVVSISQTSLTHGVVGDNCIQSGWDSNAVFGGGAFISIPSYIVTTAGGTTVYLVVSVTFIPASGLYNTYGTIRAVKIG